MTVSRPSQSLLGDDGPSRTWLRAIGRFLNEVVEGLDRARQDPTVAPLPW